MTGEFYIPVLFIVGGLLAIGVGTVFYAVSLALASRILRMGNFTSQQAMRAAFLSAIVFVSIQSAGSFSLAVISSTIRGRLDERFLVSLLSNPLLAISVLVFSIVAATAICIRIFSEDQTERMSFLDGFALTCSASALAGIGLSAMALLAVSLMSVFIRGF